MGASESRLDQTQLYKSTIAEREDTEFLKKVVTPGYGEVKIYTDQKQVNKWAVKQRVFQDKEEYENFCEILENLQSIDNPYMVNIQRVHKSFQSEYCSNFYKVYIAFDYHKLTLADQIQVKKDKKSLFSEESIYKLLICVGSALNFMNKFDIAHENIRPETILVDSQQKLYKLTNIKFMNYSMSQYQAFLTGMGENCYLAPEQMESLKRRDHNPVSDFQKTEVFSLGLVVLEAGTYSDIQDLYNFDENSFNTAKLEEFLLQFEKNYSKNLVDFLRKMLAVDPEERINLKDLENILIEVDNQYGYTLYKSTHDPVNRTFFETQVFMSQSKNRQMLSSKNNNLPKSKLQNMETSKVIERYQPQIVSTQRILVNPENEKQIHKKLQLNSDIDENEKENYNSNQSEKEKEKSRRYSVKKQPDFKKKVQDENLQFDDEFDNIDHENISEHHQEPQMFPQYQSQQRSANFKAHNNTQLDQSLASVKKSSYSITNNNQKKNDSPYQNQLNQEDEPYTYYHSKQNNASKNTHKNFQQNYKNKVQRNQKPSLSSMGIGDVSPINQKYSPFNNTKLKNSQVDLSLQSIRETQIDQSHQNLNTDQFEAQLNQIKAQAQKTNQQIKQSIQNKQKQETWSQHHKKPHTKQDNINLMNSYSEQQNIKTKQLRDQINMENSQQQSQQSQILQQLSKKIQHSSYKPESNNNYNDYNSPVEKEKNYDNNQQYYNENNNYNNNNGNNYYSENNQNESVLDQEALQKKFEKLNAKLEQLEEKVQSGNKQYRMSYLLSSNHFGVNNNNTNKLNQSNISRGSAVVRHSQFQGNRNGHNNNTTKNSNYIPHTQKQSNYQLELQRKLKNSLAQKNNHNQSGFGNNQYY
ncbi:Protein kinase-like domain [Pseudocohnilembus persalinus]|uniref:non-specific serine/threonine protein kinase n=1 Tax=Pseudocohnilembus persalinus TaxID=266149 RepID=A0A0V0Q8C5_PSEPJ|nr:Protein kinase-like domain [Pseudocohnilembus persalinus]|eukprot:KRW98446.1 Protein kinase-like domain [Pseudocohnilembus persalinus]